MLKLSNYKKYVVRERFSSMHARRNGIGAAEQALVFKSFRIKRCVSWPLEARSTQNLFEHRTAARIFRTAPAREPRDIKKKKQTRLIRRILVAVLRERFLFVRFWATALMWQNSSMRDLPVRRAFLTLPWTLTLAWQGFRHSIGR